MNYYHTSINIENYREGSQNQGDEIGQMHEGSQINRALPPQAEHIKHPRLFYALPQPATIISMPHSATAAPSQSYVVSFSPSTTLSHSNAVKMYTPP